MKRLTIIGHRGAKGLAKENTKESILAALENKADSIEIDLRVQDGNIILSHDTTVRTEDYCSLQDALLSINELVPVILDIKDPKVVDLLPSALSSYNGSVVFTSHSFRVLQHVKKLIPDAELAIIEKWSGVRAVAEATLLGTKRIHIKQNWLWSKVVRSMVAEGYDLYPYTVNTKLRAQELADWGVSGIFTDYPDRFNKK